MQINFDRKGIQLKLFLSSRPRHLAISIDCFSDNVFRSEVNLHSFYMRCVQPLVGDQLTLSSHGLELLVSSIWCSVHSRITARLTFLTRYSFNYVLLCKHGASVDWVLLYRLGISQQRVAWKGSNSSSNIIFQPHSSEGNTPGLFCAAPNQGCFKHASTSPTAWRCPFQRIDKRNRNRGIDLLQVLFEYILIIGGLVWRQWPP